MGQAGPDGAGAAVAAANTDNFLASFFEPQCGQAAPCHRLERTNNSKLLSQFEHSNSYNGM